ncbi:hypothetical protein BsIDN1_62530 [Bacillus safensis]|uniref:Uncharacterized protein n=1 Tax=Bacillus safensis TaxID=561879 RepID=A0A5S9MIL5_BACIA|nr:hypothetical protein BsIDN1_62530 [Bacillus safensis]
MKSRLILTNQSDTQLQLSFTDADKAHAFSCREAGVVYISEARQSIIYKKRQQVIESRLSALEDESVSNDSKVDKERFLYELESTKLGMKQAKIVDPAQVLDEGNKGMSAKKSGHCLDLSLALASRSCLWSYPKCSKNLNDELEMSLR